MNPIKDRIEEIRTKGYELDFGAVFEHAIENYKKIALYAGLMLLVFTFLFIILLLGIAFSVFGVDTVTEALKPENLEPENLSEEFLVIYLGSSLLISCLLSPFQAGFLKMADCGEKGEEFHVSTIFEYYKSPYFVNIFASTFIITLISTGLSTLLEMAGIKSIGLIISLTISFVTFLTVPLIVFGKLNAVEAIKSSVLIVSKQPLVLLGLLIVAIIGAVIGLFAFCVGMFFTFPFMYSMNYIIYNTIIGIDCSSGIDEIAKNEN